MVGRSKCEETAQGMGKRGEKKPACPKTGRGLSKAETTLREGACIPLSCVFWPAVKRHALPDGKGSPQGVIVPESQRGTVDRGNDGQRSESFGGIVVVLRVN